MDLKFEGFSYENVDYYQMSLNIRSIVFVQELGFDKHLEFDGKDFKAIHYIIICDGAAIGSARFTERDQIITLDRFCILKEFRKKGFAHVFIKYIMDDILPSKKLINIFSVKDTIDFFLKSGFKSSGTIEKFGNSEVYVLNY